MGFLLFLLVVLIVVVMVLKFAGMNANLKSDQIEFDTQKSIQEITNALRSFRCSMDRLEGDPLAGANGGPVPVIEVLMSGKATFVDAFKHFGAGMSGWGVQVIVYDLGNKRHVELVAVGERGLSVVWSSYATQNNYYNLKHSKDYRDRIAQAIA